MTIDLNLDGVEAWKGGAMLSAGNHVCRITEAAEGLSSGGHQQIELKLEAIQGPEIGGTIRDKIVVTGNTLGKVRQLFEAAEYKAPAGNFGFDAASIVGHTVKIMVRDDLKNDGSGETWRNVKAYESLSGADFAAATGTTPVPSGASSGAEDDIPF